MRGARLVNWLQDIFPEVAASLGVGPTRGALGRLLRRLRDGSLRRAAANVVLGQRMRERVTALGIDPRKIAVIPNWADGARLHPTPPDGNPLRAEWGLSDRFVVGYSGNMGRVHDFRTVLEAADSLRTQSDIVFQFIGGGAQMEALQRAVTERGLSNVVFKPYQPREMLGQSLGAADVHLVTLRPELEGLVVPSKFSGVAAVGRPTIFIGDPEGEIGSIVREATCGLCVEEGDVDALVGAITTLRGDRPLRTRMGANARRAFDERYDKESAVRQWRRLLLTVAETESAYGGRG
jgi:glycosyltransferase involved in cell wall biosynthesis